MPSSPLAAPSAPQHIPMSRPSLGLPADLIPTIAQHLCSSRRLLTLATLARCSRSTYAAAMPWLYRRVELTEEAAESLFDPLVEVCELYDCGRDLPVELLLPPPPSPSPSSPLRLPSPSTSTTPALHANSAIPTSPRPRAVRLGKQRASHLDVDIAFHLPLSLRRLQHLRHVRTLVVRDLLYGHTVDQLKLLSTALDDRDLLLLPALENVVISHTAIERIRRAEKVRKRIPEGLLEAIALAGKVKRVCIHMPPEVPEGMMIPGQRFGRRTGPIGGMGGMWAIREHMREMDGGRRRDGPAPRPRERERSPPPAFGEAVAAPPGPQPGFAFGEDPSASTAGPSALPATSYPGPPPDLPTPPGLPPGAVLVDPRGARDARNTWMAPVTSIYAWLEKLDDTAYITAHNVPPSIILPARPAAQHTFVYRELPQDGGEVYVDPGAGTSSKNAGGDDGVFEQTLQQIQDCIRRSVPPKSTDLSGWAGAVARTSWTFHIPPVEWDEVLSDAVRGWAREAYPLEVTEEGEVVSVEERIGFRVFIPGGDNGWCEACGDEL